MKKPNVIKREPQHALPTETVLGEYRVGDWSLISLQVTNTDETQTLACRIDSRLTVDDDYAPSTLPDLAEIPPLATRKVDIDCRGVLDIQLVGAASGIGLDCFVSGLMVE
jgi:hypothetical protein